MGIAQDVGKLVIGKQNVAIQVSFDYSGNGLVNDGTIIFF